MITSDGATVPPNLPARVHHPAQPSPGLKTEPPRPREKMQGVVWHLTHTDIRVDFRLQKAIQATALVSQNVLGMSFNSRTSYDVQESDGVRLKGYRVPFGRKRPPVGVETATEIGTIELEVASEKSRWVQRAATIPYAIFKLVARAKQDRPALVYVHDFPLLIPALFVSKLFKTKMVYDAHELNGHAFGHTGLWSKVMLASQKIAWPHLHGFVTVSGSILQWYLDRYGPKNHCLITNSPMSAPLSSRPVLPVDLRSKLGIEPDKVVFCYLGALEPGRNIDKLLLAFGRRNRVSSMVFIGNGSLSNEITYLAAQSKSIFYHPPVQNWAIADLIAEVDFGFALIEPVSLSDQLCLPNKLFEYLDSGVIPICSKLPDIEKVIEESGTGRTLDSTDRELESLLLELEADGRPEFRANLPDKYRWSTQKETLASFIAATLTLQT